MKILFSCSLRGLYSRAGVGSHDFLVDLRALDADGRIATTAASISASIAMEAPSPADRNDWRRSVHRPQSSSASRRTSCVAGLFDLIQSSELPDRQREPIRFETIPSSPILQAWRKPSRLAQSVARSAVSRFARERICFDCRSDVRFVRHALASFARVREAS